MEAKSFRPLYCCCNKNGIIVGFGDIDNTGYLDRLYVHKDYQNQGIAKAMCDKLEQHNAYNEITTHASITAKPFLNIEDIN